MDNVANTDQLLPCPCCGSDAELTETSIGAYVCCSSLDCDISNRHKNWTAKKAVEIWNARHVPEGMVLVKKPTLLPKGEPMPQTIDAWHVLADGYERVMLKDKETISLLKQRINNLEQKLRALQGE
ncbi:Lar family restriction alleviation protein [Amphritea sp. HPY]|uniref:Lar family restriction alleviation protein n=1 Tax=Amphritea sp. HPY TaxID=3421652 RepID=UPI003D7D9828